MGSVDDVAGLACRFGSLSHPEGSVRIGEFGMSGDEDAWREVQDFVECVEEGEFGGIGDLARRRERRVREAALALHPPAPFALACLALRLSSASRSR